MSEKKNKITTHELIRNVHDIQERMILIIQNESADGITIAHIIAFGCLYAKYAPRQWDDKKSAAEFIEALIEQIWDGNA
jgi:hypothetical protein